MYQVSLLAKQLANAGLGTFGTSIFVGRFDDTKPNQILLTNVAGSSSPVTLNGRSLFENDIVNFNITGSDNYSESIDFVNSVYNYLRDNKQFRSISIIDLTANQPVLMERTKDNIYKFGMTVEVLYNQKTLSSL